MERDKATEKQLKQYYIAYFDVLGYKAVFGNSEENVLEFLQSIIGACEETKERAEFETVLLSTRFYVKTFSDNFLIMVEAPTRVEDYHVLRLLSYILSSLQAKVLSKYKILLRGGVTKGDAYIDDNIVFGEGLIRAVSLEDKTAVFPRIVFDADRFASLTLKKLLANNNVLADSDGLFYVDYFIELPMREGRNKKTNYEHMKSSIAEIIRKYGKYKKPGENKEQDAITEKTVSKYAWVLTKFNEHCRTDNLTPISFEYRLNEQIMKPEIVINN